MRWSYLLRGHKLATDLSSGLLVSEDGLVHEIPDEHFRVGTWDDDPDGAKADGDLHLACRSSDAAASLADVVVSIDTTFAALTHPSRSSALPSFLPLNLFTRPSLLLLRRQDDDG